MVQGVSRLGKETRQSWCFLFVCLFVFGFGGEGVAHKDPRMEERLGPDARFAFSFEITHKGKSIERSAWVLCKGRRVRGRV